MGRYNMPAHYAIVIFTLVLFQFNLIIHAKYLPDDSYFYGPGMVAERYYADKSHEELHPEYQDNSQWSSELGYQQNDHDQSMNSEMGREYADDRHSKSVETPAEPLPVPMALANNNDKPPIYKKSSNSNYYMSLCHFKICNMGRKRNTRYLHLNTVLGNLQRNRPIPAM